MKKKNISVRVSWLRAYIIVVLIMSLLFFLCTLMVLREVEKNAAKINANDAEFVRNTLDDNWKRVFDYSLQIIGNSSARSLESMSGDEMFRSDRAYDLCQNFKNYFISNTMVEEIYLYYPSSDYVVGDRGVYPSHTYWVSLYGASPEVDDQTWMNTLFGNRASGYFTLRQGNRVDLYYRMAVSDIRGRVLVAKINTAQLEQTLGWISRDHESSFLGMTDADGTVYAYSGNYERFVDADTNRLLPADGGQFLATALPSSIGQMQYVTITERNTAYKLADTIAVVAFVSLLLAFLSGVAVSAFLVRKSAAPVERIAAKLRPDGADGCNELQMIDSQVDELLHENQSALSALTRQQNIMISRSFLNECLKLEPGPQQYVETIAAIYGLSFENDRFSVVVRERAGLDYSDRILELLAGLEEDEMLVCWTQRQDLDVFLLNYDAPAEKDPSPVDGFVEQIRAISSDKTRIVSGSASANPEAVRSGYLDCLRQLHRKGVLLPEGTENTCAEYGAIEGQSTLNTFFRLLYDADYQGARKLVPELYSGYIASGGALERTCRKYHVLQQLLSLQPQVGEAALSALAAEQSAELWQSRLCALLAQCAQHAHRQDATYENDLAGRIRSFIDRSYANPMLDLRMIAEELDVSQSYASRMFKQKYAIGTSQYINQVRIAHAKELIRFGSQNIKSIALQVGFSSDVQFIRVFKKFEVVTPGTFREKKDE